MTRDPDLPGRLLLAERAVLIPLLRATPAADFALATNCPGWTVRDVLAHCAAALTHIARNTLHDLSPAANDRDIADRAGWSVEEIVDELAEGFLRAGPVIAAGDGGLDVIALGEWVHGGDVREALGKPDAYASAGVTEALRLLGLSPRVRARPRVLVTLPHRRLDLGDPVPGRQPATLVTNTATLIRLYCGRPADPAEYELRGATADELVIYR
ncbi:MAG: maleylpyruvate isomerase family mycothiol-dependent enzyme [Actinomycetota bacterium]|nr:maleylpyruvate isomerase family mycothiol-dependent enzyme [Actinomycetota bacterium]